MCAVQCDCKKVDKKHYYVKYYVKYEKKDKCDDRRRV